MQGWIMKKVFLTALLTVTAALLSCTRTDGETLRRYARAKDLYAQGRFSETSTLLSETKNFVPALALRGKAEYFSGKLREAEASCRLAVKKRPQAFEAKLYLARILRDSGELDKAEKVALDLLADNPQDIRTLRFASDIAIKRGKNNEAYAFLDQAADLSSESALVLLDRARLHWAAGRGAQALEDLSRARAMLPWDTPLFKSIENLESIIMEAMK
jgi:tetratricopeptide (TPR) repeat protein